MDNNLFIGICLCGILGITIILTNKMDLDLGVSLSILLVFGMMIGGIFGYINNNFVKKTDSKTDEKPM